jgi:phosphate transport system substrate-binding protein
MAVQEPVRVAQGSAAIVVRMKKPAPGRLAALAFAAGMALAQGATLDPRLPAYQPRPAAVPAGARYVRADGTVHIVLGNRGIGVVVEGFNALFARTHPGTRFSVEYNKEGNTLNMAALIHGVTLVCPLARDINAAEKKAYAEWVGGEPLVVNIAHGTLTSVRMTAGLAVYVNKDNPVRSLTMDQLARIFTTGAPGGDLTHWGQVGATGEWAARPIHTYGTPEYSGYGYFMVKNKWGDRTFTPGYEAFELAAHIVKRVGEDSHGIGFAGQGFLNRRRASSRSRRPHRARSWRVPKRKSRAGDTRSIATSQSRCGARRASRSTRSCGNTCA